MTLMPLQVGGTLAVVAANIGGYSVVLENREIPLVLGSSDRNIINVMVTRQEVERQ